MRGMNVWLKTIGMGAGAGVAAALALVPFVIRLADADGAAAAVVPPPSAAVHASTAPALAPRPDPFSIKRVLDIPGPMRIGSYVWDDAGVPKGPMVVTVDLDAGVLSVFRDGYEIGAAAILYGADEKPTPLGRFPILAKMRDHVSRTYGNAPMPYTLRLTGDGVSIHGSSMQYGGATHGCVGVPVAFARALFGQVTVGDTVIITKGRRLDPGAQVAG